MPYLFFNTKIMNMQNFEVGQKVKAVNVELLPGNDYAPPLVLNQEYEILSIVNDKLGNQHLNVGLKSELNYVSSYETGEHLPNGESIHWCHPSRFVIV